jgi:rhodanese-related sulfurtransferase
MLLKSILKYNRIIDLRNSNEILKYGKIPNGRQVPLNELNESFLLTNNDFMKKYKFPKPNKTDNILFYCQSGSRSRHAAYIANQYGYNNVQELELGFKIFNRLGSKYKHFF